MAEPTPSDAGRLETLAQRLGAALLERRLRLVTAESCTGGAVAQAVTAVPGSSRWFERGFVAYSDRAKQDMLGVEATTLAAHGAVSEAVVLEMARAAQAVGADCVGVAVSGVAGPGGGSPRKPVGTVWIAWAGAGPAARARRFQYAGSRCEVRARAVCDALAGLLARLGDGPEA